MTTHQDYPTSPFFDDPRIPARLSDIVNTHSSSGLRVEVIDADRNQFDTAENTSGAGYPPMSAGPFDRPLQQLGCAGAFLQGVDAAFQIAAVSTDRYFFRGDQCQRRRDGATGAIRAMWPGLPENFCRNLDAADHHDGLVYFFRAGQVMAYDLAAQQPCDGYPRALGDLYPGLPPEFSTRLDAAVFDASSPQARLILISGRSSRMLPLPTAGDATGNALVVPLSIEALAVTRTVRIAEPFARWQANYALTRINLSPEPPAFSNTDTTFGQDPDREGVYLHWQLPEALTWGHEDPGDDQTRFPLVPNRWMVVRTAAEPVSGRRVEAGWVVEGDFLHPAEGSTPYLDPADRSLTRIGRRFDLATGAWTEPAPREGGLFLTAVGPGLPTFAAYQPYNLDVFSLHDDLQDLPDPRSTWQVSYLVAGWYSDPDADPLAPPHYTPARLDVLGWATAQDGTPRTARTVYQGMALQVAWRREGGTLPASDRPDHLRVAIGHTSEHATEALLKDAARRSGLSEDAADLLAACHRGLLDTREEPDGAFEDHRRTHASWFTPSAADFTWILEPAPDPGSRSGSLRAPSSDARSRAQRAADADLLATLNERQAAHDHAAGELAAAQRRLYDLWWCANLPRIPDDPDGEPGAFPTALRAALAPAAADVAQAREDLLAARALIPWGLTEDELLAAITDYARWFSPGTTLKRVPLTPFAHANDPVVVIQGTKANTDPDTAARVRDEDDDEPDLRLACRWPHQLVSAITLDGHTYRAPDTAVPAPVHLPQPVGLDGLLPALLREFFHLDPGNATALKSVTSGPASAEQLARAMGDPLAHAVGTVPVLGTTPWRQPWSPLFFEWQVDYYPIDVHDPGTPPTSPSPHWTFTGRRYHWNGTGAHPVPVTLKGRQFLGPTPGQSAGDKLDQYAATHPGPHAAALRALARQTREGNLFSEALVGFHDQIAARWPHPPVIPAHLDPDLHTALSEAATRTLPPNPGPLPRPFTGWARTAFQPVAAGQFAFHRLAVVDRFGHALAVVYPDFRPFDEEDEDPGDTVGVGTPARAFHPVLPEELAPSPRDLDDPAGDPADCYTIHDPTWYRFIQITPRLPQPAGTHLTALSADDDTHDLDQDHDPNANAIAAWLIPNHLDQALLCYTPAGAPLGELRTTLLPAGARHVTWHPLPHSTHPTPADLADDLPHLHGFVTALQTRGPAALRTLLEVIDTALTTTQPDAETLTADPAVFIGRPIALIRARLHLSLDGPPVADPTWSNLLDPAAPAYPDYTWPVRLGERDELGDGLIGYFHGQYHDTDYSVLHTVLDDVELPTSPATAAEYVRPIGSGAGLALPARHHGVPETPGATTTLGGQDTLPLMFDGRLDTYYLSDPPPWEAGDKEIIADLGTPCQVTAVHLYLGTDSGQFLLPRGQLQASTDQVTWTRLADTSSEVHYTPAAPFTARYLRILHTGAASEPVAVRGFRILITGKSPRHSAFLTLLADPRGTIHATTGLLPAASLRLPTAHVQDPLAAMAVSFRLAPLLTTTEPGHHLPSAATTAGTTQPHELANILDRDPQTYYLSAGHPAEGTAITLDLGEDLHLTRINLYLGDPQGDHLPPAGTLEARTGTATAWTPLLTTTAATPEVHYAPPGDLTARHLRLRLTEPGDQPLAIRAFAYTGHTALTLPVPSPRHGIWDWAQLDGDTWTQTPTHPADSTARPRPNPALRTGALHLKPAASED
ncbi:discoidin domain-containing protein [Kitasatospora sp. NPDC058162]|uniref:discoidin domain-containing protein n=1 Tax=Kitasatospora sp. NPDC058162 TaxID=3346362 RepID=UPI0036DD317F